jgi:hypothetical protein
VELVKPQILRAAAQNSFAVIDCFMLAHLHLLVEGLGDDSDCLRFINDPHEYPFVGSEMHSLEELLEAVADVRST